MDSTQTIRLIIVDDEPLAREVLTSFVQGMNGVRLIGCCKNAAEAYLMLQKESVDIMLLDINLPDLTGIELLRSIKTPPAVIFTTAYAEHAVESYELNAIDYLMKPIAKDRLEQAIQKFVSTRKVQEPQQERFFVVRSEGKWNRIAVDTILYIEALKDYVRIHTSEDRIVVHSTMKNIEDQLKPFPEFVRIHKSYIVNQRFVKSFDQSVVSVGGATLSIGSTYKGALIRLTQNG